MPDYVGMHAMHWVTGTPLLVLHLLLPFCMASITKGIAIIPELPVLYLPVRQYTSL